VKLKELPVTTSGATTRDYPAKRKYIGGIAAEYVDKRTEHPTWVWEQEQVRRWASSRPTGSSILDVPFGTGRYVPLYLAAGLKVLGCEISPDMVANAERELGSSFNQCDVSIGDAEAMVQYRDNSVDAVISSRFIQWLPDISIVERVLAEFARVAREELFLQVRVPAGVPAPGQDHRFSIRRKIRRLFSSSPTQLLDLARKRARRDPSLDWKTYTYAEPLLVETARQHGWHIAAVGVECPTSPGLRFYRFTKNPT
jgi:hypothetical protein